MRSNQAPLTAARAEAFVIPTDAPEADGTLSWTSTCLVVVTVEGGGKTGVGYTYADACIVSLINGKFQQLIIGSDAFDIGAIWDRLQGAVRNIGRSGLAATAISAVDTALWDLKAKLLDTPLAALFGRRRNSAPVYGSGGFTSYDNARLRDQLSGWVERDGCRAVKMKVGSRPGDDIDRVASAKSAIGKATLFVDANGAYGVKESLSLARSFSETAQICWFEEPVSSDDETGLALIRQSIQPGVDVAAGEYIYTVDDARRLLKADAVDVLQADASRCGGFTGFLQIAALCDAHHIDLSGHCAPALHRHVACAAPRLRHLEWFHDHVRIEQMLFDGAPVCRNGEIEPDLTRPGNGLTFKRADAVPYQVS